MQLFCQFLCGSLNYLALLANDHWPLIIGPWLLALDHWAERVGELPVEGYHNFRENLVHSLPGRSIALSI